MKHPIWSTAPTANAIATAAITPLNASTPRRSIKLARRTAAAATAAAASALVLSGCATSITQMSQSAQSRTAQHIEASTQAQLSTPAAAPTPTVRTLTHIAPVGKTLDVMDERLAVSLDVQNVPLMGLVDTLASRMGYSASAMSTVDPAKRVSVKFKVATPEQAIRQLAWAAGYVAVINPADKSVTLSNEATMVFRVPADDLQKLINTSFSFGGNPIGGGGGSGGGASGGANFSPVSSDFKVSGTYTNNPAGFTQFIEDMAGANAQVRVFLEMGMISVRANGQALKRVHDFLGRYAFDARRQVEITAKVVEVTLGNEFRYGIQWDKVVDSGRLRLGLNGLQALGTGNNPASLRFTGTNVTSLVQALESLTDVEVTSTPHLTVSNHSSGVIFEGTQKPYLPSVTSTTTDGTTTLSGSGAYASDGIQMAVHAKILDDDNAVLTVVPSTVTLGDLKTFLNDQVQMYEQSVRNGGQRIVIRSGETYVISGNRYTRGNNSQQGLPGVVRVPVLGAATSGVTKESQARQTVIIMSARILRPEPMDIVFSESI